MANIIKRVWNQNRMVQIEDLKGMTFQAEQAGHTFQISGIDDDGNTVALTGSVAGVFLRPDNTDVAITGSASGGVVSVTLPANCYAVPGRFGLTIFITSGSSKTAIYAAVGTVTRTSSGTAAPGTTQSVVDLINAINAAINSIPASYSALLADIAPTYSNSALYSVSQYAWYDGDLKRCIVPITTAESYTAAHWTSAVLGQDVSDLKSAFNEFGDALNYTPYNILNNKSIDTNTSQPILPANIKTENNWCCVCEQCSEGDTFILTGRGGNASRLWAFSDSNGGLIEQSGSAISATNLKITAPANSAFFAYNSRMDVTHEVYKGTKPIDVYAKIEDDITQTKSSIVDDVTKRVIRNEIASPYLVDLISQNISIKRVGFCKIEIDGTALDNTTISISQSGFSLIAGKSYTLFVKTKSGSSFDNTRYLSKFIFGLRDENGNRVQDESGNVQTRIINNVYTFIPTSSYQNVYLTIWQNTGSSISLDNEQLNVYLVEGNYKNIDFQADEMPYYVTPEQFGAVGDGVTDDTDAWNMAVMSGGVVIARSNQYKCGTIHVNKNVDIDCNGAIFTCTASVLFECNGEEASHSNQSKYTRNSMYRLSRNYETYTGLAYIKGNNNLFKQRDYYVGGFIEHFNNGWLDRTQPFDVIDPVVYFINPISVILKNIGNVTFANPENSYVIKQLYCENSHISNINMTNVCYSVVQFEKCYSCTLENCHIDIPIYIYASNNYPIGYDDSYYIIIKGTYCHNATWHCISGGGYTVNRGAKIEDCILASDGSAPAIGDHENCIETNVIGTDSTSITVGLLSVISNCTIHPKNDSSVCRISLMLCSKQGTSEDEAFSLAKYVINDVLFDVRRTGNSISSQCSIYLLCSPQSESGYSAEYGFEKIILSNITKSNDHLHTSTINDDGIVNRVYTDGSVKYGRTVIMNSDFTALYPKDTQGQAINIKFPDDFIEI